MDVTLTLARDLRRASPSVVLTLSLTLTLIQTLALALTLSNPKP